MGLHIVYVPLWHVLLMMPSRWKTMPERVQMYGRWLTAQQKDERQHDNGDKKQLARHHLSDLLCSLNCEQDRRRTAQLRLDSALSLAISFDQTFHMLRVRHMMCMCIPIVSSI